MRTGRNSSKLNEKISDAEAYPAKSVEQINTGVDQISSFVQTYAAAAEQSAAAADELSSQAATLEQLVSQFRLRL